MCELVDGVSFRSFDREGIIANVVGREKKQRL